MSIRSVIPRFVKKFYYRYGRLSIIRKRLTRNNPQWQSRHWAEQLRNEDPSSASRIGFRWGDPSAENDRLGNYRRIYTLLRESIGPDTCILEIGSYGGKWTEHMKGARRIICVDLFDYCFEFLRQRLPEYPIEFYRTTGDELKGISSESVDLVFSTDSLVRAPKHAIRNYIGEMMRVLVPGGHVIVHLPCDDSPLSPGMYFTSISRKQIEKLFRNAGFAQTIIDMETLKHGALVLAGK